MNSGSVVWLQAIELERDLTLADWNQAKAMHKEEIVDAHNRGIWAEPKPFDDGEQYYNETFGGNNE